MRSLKQYLFGLTFALLLLSCGEKPKNPSVPNVETDSSKISDRTSPNQDFALKKFKNTNS